MLIKNITYSVYKTVFGLEAYLECIKYYKLRSVISRLRLSSHNLEIEKGYHSNPPNTFGTWVMWMRFMYY